MTEEVTRHRIETSEISTDSVSLSCVFMAEAARPVGRAWSCPGDVARVMGVAGGTPGSGPITLCRVLSTKDTMERTCDTCHGDSHTCRFCCLCRHSDLQERQAYCLYWGDLLASQARCQQDKLQMSVTAYYTGRLSQ